ncbi:DUF6850 family outer membrane beta-barrel protein [Pedobacter nototheniae]|uniref:DUF6850 family outer membrane beta-barrel protein n=1 Tax=Pedobacter nototheniae TaxID=2488994 RepID=UPI00103F27E0|nr:DUF6850 family outer membrane beta-barrel protein [Pedobacter nototheniae]
MLKNKFLTIVLSLLFFSALAYAQNGKDSVYIFNQDKKLVENRLLSPTFSNGSDLKSYGLLQLDFKHENGGFRRAQEAYKINSPKFLAQGFNVLGRFRIAGSFEFNKSFEDSLANGQKNNLEDFTTYYPYANKSGHYTRQNYIIKTSLSYSAFNDHILSYLNLDYHKHESYGTVDPRLSSNRFIVKVKPGIAFKFKKQVIGVYGILGKADETVSLSYKNDNFKSSFDYPDRIHYMLYGYGSSKIKDSSTVYKYDNYKGAGIEYALTSSNWNIQASTEYQLFENKNYDRGRTVKGFATIGIFYLNTFSGSLLITKKEDNQNNQQLAINAIYNEGYDGNLKTSGSLNKVNYRVNAFNLNMSYYYLWNKHKKTSKELGLTFAYNQNDKQDLGQSDGLAYEQIQAGISTKLYHQIDNKSRFNLSLSPYYSFPLNATLKYNPNSLTEFIRNVVFTDYYYFKAKTIGVELSGEYITSKLIKNQQFGFYFNYNYNNMLNQELRNDLNPTFVPNGNRTVLHLGINMYL